MLCKRFHFLPLPRTLALLLLAPPVFTAAGLRAQESAPSPAEEPVAAQAAPAEAVDGSKTTLATVALVRLAGTYADLPAGAADIASMLLGGSGKQKAFYELIDKLDALTADESRMEVLFDLSDSIGLGHVQLSELERCLRRMRKAGKSTCAYLESAGNVQIQIAAMCDKVLMADMGAMDIPSASLSVTFMKDAMDLLGVQMDVVRCGDFKGAVEPYVLSNMSHHLRQHYLDMLGRINDDTVRRLASGRDIGIARVRELQEQRLLTAQQAHAEGLVDELVPWVGAKRAIERVTERKGLKFDDVLDAKKDRKPLNFFTLMSNLLNPKGGDEEVEKGLVVLHLSGTISDGTKAVPGSIVSGPTVSEIRRLTSDQNVRGVVVRINSPGGSATASEAILLALTELSAAKPVVVSMGALAASGGYYVTCFGRPILAEAGTITGSIGVFGMRPNLGPLMRRVGVNEEIVALDEGASMSALGRAWSNEQKATIQGFVDSIYDRFTAHVSASRHIPVVEVLKLAGGRVWSGEQAVANRLVDRIGGLGDALEMVAKEAGLEPGYPVTHRPRSGDAFAVLLRDMMDAKALLPDPVLRVVAQRIGGLERALRLLLESLTNEQPCRAWVLMPESIEIR